MDLFNLAAKITLQTGEFEKGLEASRTQITTFGNKLKGGLATSAKIGAAAVGAMAAAAGAMTKAVLDGTKEVAVYGDNIDKASQKMGISAEAYQEWDAILQHSGSSIDALRRGMMTLTNAAADGKAAFSQLGITQEELAAMNQEEIFERTIAALQQMESGTERAALANDLLGGSAKELGALLNTSAEDTEAMRKRVHELGGVMSNEAVKAAAAYQDSLQDMQTAMAGVKRNITTQFLPSVKSLMDGLTDVFSGNETSGIGKIKEGLNGFAQKLSETVPKVIELGGTIVLSLSEAIIDNAGTIVSAGGQLVLKLASGITKGLPKMVKSGVEIIKTLGKSFKENVGPLLESATEAVVEIAETLTSPDTLATLIDSGIELVLSIGDGLLKAIPQLVGKVPKIIGNIVDSLTSSNAIGLIVDGGTKLLLGLVDAVPAVIADLSREIPTLIDKIVDLVVDGIPKLAEGASQLFAGIVEAIPDVVVGIAAAMPDIIGAILTGLADGAAAIFSAIDGLVTGSTERIKASNEKIAEHVEEVKAFADALANTSPQLVDYTRLLSEQGNTIADLDAKTRNAENAITEILAAALQEQRSIREEDLASIQSYMDELSRLAEEKLQIYRSQQVAELLKLQLESGEITRETAAQHIANAQEALDRTNSITEEAYTARLTTIQQKYEAMGEVGSAAYKAELDAAKAAHDAQLAENQDYYAQALGEIEKYASSTIQVEEGKWKKLNDGLESWKSTNGEAVNEGMLAWKNGVGSINDAKDDYLKILSEMDLNTANGFLNMVAEVVAGGGKISEETKQTAANMLGAFDNLPESLDKAGKDALLGLIYGIESKIPGLENTADMTANEIVDTIKAVLGIASPSKVLKDIGINTIQGLIDGMREKTGSVMSQAKTIVSGLVAAVADFVPQFSPIGSNMAAGLWSGFAAQESGLMSRVRSAMQRIVAAARSELQIASPSKVFAKIGAYSAEGLGVGWDSEIDGITRGIADDLDFSGLASSRAAGPRGVGGVFGAAPVTINITVNGAEGQSVMELADEIERRLVGSYNARRAAYA